MWKTISIPSLRRGRFSTAAPSEEVRSYAAGGSMCTSSSTSQPSSPCSSGSTVQSFSFSPPESSTSQSTPSFSDQSMFTTPTLPTECHPPSFDRIPDLHSLLITTPLPEEPPTSPHTPPSNPAPPLPDVKRLRRQHGKPRSRAIITPRTFSDTMN
jgi:hypothetical protein